MKKILIIGGSSDLGRELGKLLGYEFSNLDIQNNNEFIEDFIYADITNIDSLNILKEKEYDAVIHISGIHPITASDDHDLMFKVNVDGVSNVLNCLSLTKTRHFIYISSSSAKNSTTLYGRSKQMGEKIVESFVSSHGFKAYALRTRGFTPYYSKAYSKFEDYANWVFSGAVHIKDVVNCIDLCVKNPTDNYELFLVDGKNDFSKEELNNWNVKMIKDKYPDHLELINKLSIPKNPPQYQEVINFPGYKPSFGISYLFEEYITYLSLKKIINHKN